MNTLQQWIDGQYRHSAQAMLRSISPVHLVKERPGFGQRIRPAKGAVVASPIMAAYDPDPDYFFHWFRDSAIVIDALRLLHADGSLGAQALTLFAEFVHFSLALNELDGRTLVADAAWRRAVTPDFEKFVRLDEDLAGSYAEAIASETRVNPDGTLDISKWGRPQNDGPPLRALTLLRWLQCGHLGAELQAATAQLLRTDLAFTCAHWRDASYDIWEEEKGQHYYTLCVSAGALEQGAAWHERQRERALADSTREQAQAIRKLLDGYWLETSGYYRSRVLEVGRSTKELDIAVILAAVHAPSDAATHSTRDRKMHATLDALDALFAADYPINHVRQANRSPAMGRYAGDVYYSGGAYYFSTLGAAEFCYRAAIGSGPAAAKWIARGDGYLETVRAYTPDSGELSEQFDQKSGEQTSAKQLAWSYAGFISSVVARRAAMRL